MAIDSLGGKEPIKNEKKYTMESLGIKEGSEDASIFNKIDKSDGKEDGALSQFQFIIFLKTWIRKTLNNKD